MAATPPPRDFSSPPSQTLTGQKLRCTLTPNAHSPLLLKETVLGLADLNGTSIYKVSPDKDGVAMIPALFTPCPEQCHNEGTKHVNCGGGKPHRLNPNVTHMTALELDFDHKSKEQAANIFAKASALGIAFGCWHTHSHSPNANDHRFRLVFPFAEPLPISNPTEWSAIIWPALVAKFGFLGEADDSAKDPARLYFLPSKPDGAPAGQHVAAYSPGICFDPRDAAQAARDKAKTKAAAPTSPRSTGGADAATAPHATPPPESEWPAIPERRKRASAYVATMPGAVSGAGGHKQTFKVAQRLVKGFALPNDIAYELFTQYNARCQPPWTEQELRHKLDDATRSTMPLGLMFGSGRESAQEEAALHADPLARIRSAAKAEDRSAAALALMHDVSFVASLSAADPATLDILKVELKRLGINRQAVDAVVSDFRKPVQDQERGPTDNAAPEAPAQDEHVVAAANELLRQPDLETVLYNDLAADGLVGEELAVKTLLFVISTRKTKRPVHAVVKAASSSGKNYVLGAVLKRLPECEVLTVSDMSARALLYLPRSLKGMVFAIAEQEGAQKADYTIRTAQSEGSLSVLVAEKTEEGRVETREQRVEGPACFITTTTRAKLHDENETRVLEIMLDESEEQTRRVIVAQAVRAANPPPVGAEVKAAERIEVWRTAFGLLELTETINPHAPELAATFRSSKIRARRDFLRVLDLAGARALLYQKQREVRDSRVVVSREDVAAAAKLCEALVSDVPARLRSFIERLSAALAGSEFTAASAAKVLGYDPDAARRMLKSAAKLDLVEETETGKGSRPSKWRVYTPVEPSQPAKPLPATPCVPPVPSAPPSSPASDCPTSTDISSCRTSPPGAISGYISSDSSSGSLGGADAPPLAGAPASAGGGVPVGRAVGQAPFFNNAGEIRPTAPLGRTSTDDAPEPGPFDVTPEEAAAEPPWTPPDMAEVPF